MKPSGEWTERWGVRRNGALAAPFEPLHVPLVHPVFRTRKGGEGLCTRTTETRVDSTVSGFGVCGTSPGKTRQGARDRTEY